MFIAFEGPDKTGKSTSAANLCSGIPTYNATKGNYERLRNHEETHPSPENVHCFDRIDWLTHMIYRLALPDYEWNDQRVRTVFTMPDTHLVFKLHTAGARNISDELYEDGTLYRVNNMYESYAEFFRKLNRDTGWKLFRSVSVMRVNNRLNEENPNFTAHLEFFESRNVAIWGGWPEDVCDDETLLDLLKEVG